MKSIAASEPPHPIEPDSLDISFFIPCYNEEANVIGAIHKVSHVAQAQGLTYEILIFDDCSQDNTVAVVENYCRQHSKMPILLFVNSVNRGVSRNFFEGAFWARGKYYRLVCGDDVEPIESHLKLIQNIGKAEIIVPYFTKIGGRKFHRHVISNTFTALVNFSSGYRMRYYNGCPIYRRFDLLRFHVESTGFGYQAEFLTRLLHEGKTFIEVPIESIDREGSGSLNIRNFLSVGHSLLKIALRRLRVYMFK